MTNENSSSTRLLVSVRDASEARAALAAGAQLIDVKEPSRGSLGAAEFHTIGNVLSVVGGHVPISAAMGELFEASPYPSPFPKGERTTLRYLKWGLAGALDHEDWTRLWAERVASLPVETNAVAVQYADWRQARSPSPRELLAACREYGVRTLLVDTHDKSGGGLLDVWPIDSLREFLDAARDLELMIVLGGSLTLESIPRVMLLQPDYIAVRGAACHGDRTGSIDPRRVRALRALLD